MKLYYVQDADRPLHVLAEDLAHAVGRWKAQISREDPESFPTADHVDDPDGAHVICDGTEVLLPEGLAEPLGVE